VLALDQLDEDMALSARRRLNLSSRIQWRLGAGESFSLQSFFSRGLTHNTGEGTLQALGGTPDAPYATRDTDSQSAFDVARLNVQLTRRVATDTRIELRGGAGRFSLDNRSALTQFAADGTTVQERLSRTSFDDTSWSLAAKLMHSLGGGHSLVGGVEIEGTRRREDSATLIGGVLQEGAFGTGLAASTLRQAVYLQDEWDPAPDWSAYAGLRAETLRTRGDSSGAATENRSNVVSPLAHLVWRFNAPKRDQLRLSLTQSYRAPTLRNLIALPTLNALYPVPGGNVASSPDRAGNPALEPERSHGIDLALERYLAQGGVLSVNLFHRRIRDLIRDVTTLEDVAWADEPRWVSRPRNLGRATAQGIEFDAKFRLTELRADAPALDLRMNLSLYRSRVDSVPGPDNRIDQQPRAVGNFGADYRLPRTPWTVGGSLGVTPGYRTQLTELQSQEAGLRRVLDAYVLWQFDSETRVRLSLANLAPIDSSTTASVLQGTQWQRVASAGRTDTSATLRLEMRL